MRPTEFPKTLQEIFNIVWERAKDRRRAKDQRWALRSHRRCSYRSKITDPTSLACFIGECIPDKAYIPQLDDENIDSPIDDVLRKYTYLFPVEWDGILEQLRSLQEIHDLYGPSDWEQKLVDFAKNNNLTIPQ